MNRLFIKLFGPRAETIAPSARGKNGDRTSLMHPIIQWWRLLLTSVLLLGAIVLTRWGAPVNAESSVLAPDRAMEQQNTVKPTANPTAQIRGGNPVKPIPTKPLNVAYVNVSPSSGTAGTQVTVKGGGFPGGIVVDIYLASVVQLSDQGESPNVYGSGLTNSAGLYSVTFSMPETWPDGEPIRSGQLTILVANNDFSQRATTSFDYTASASTPTWTPTDTPTNTPLPTDTSTPVPTKQYPNAQVSPRSGTAGTQVTVRGGGFPTNTRIGVYIAGIVRAAGVGQGPTAYAVTTTDNKGNYTMRFVMPATWPDGEDIRSGELAILVATSDFTIRANDTFDYVEPAPTPTNTATYTPTPTSTPTHTPTSTPTVPSNPYAEASPKQGGPNVGVTVFGGGFPANTQVNLHLGTFDGQVGNEGGTIVTYATTQTDAVGNYRMTFTTPETWPDGTRLPSSKILLLVTTNEFEPQASAIYDYAAPPPTATPTDTYTPLPAPTSTFTPLPTVTPTKQNPYVQIRPWMGSAGTEITVRGGEFPANTEVGVYIAGVVRAAGVGQGPTAYAKTTTDGKGDYSMRFVMPATWPDGVAITTGKLAILVATNDFLVRATGTFDYVIPTPTHTPTPRPTATHTPLPTHTPVPTATPTAALNPYAEALPTRVGPNNLVRIAGGGFPANSRVNLHLAKFDGQIGEGEVVHYAGAITNANGNYSMTFVMPSVWPDGTLITDRRLLVVVATRDFEYEAGAVIEYVPPVSAPTPTPIPLNPTIQMNPDSGSAGTTIELQGGGFPANTRVDVYLSGIVRITASAASQPTSYANTTTDVRGNYRVRFVMPAQWPDGRTIKTGKLAVLVATEDFENRATSAFDYLASDSTPTNTPTPRGDEAWRGEYFANSNLAGAPILVRQDEEIDFFWETRSPAAGVPADRFSVRWTRTVFFASGIYRISVLTDDGMRVWLDGNLIIDEWSDQRSATFDVDINISEGLHDLRVEYYENTLGARARVWWKQLTGPSPTSTWTPVPPEETPLFDGDPRTNQRRQAPSFCSGFVTECDFAGCPRNYRLLWGPYCRESDYPYIQPGEYKVTIHGQGRVRIGATDYGETGKLFAFARRLVNLPASYTFCWKGLQPGGYGFETIVQSLGSYASVDRVTIEYIDEECR
ncbi:hypothetical protein KFU94_62515 [Chloroflexi bacterium TSY]|nr:hypothetical protein [Chloroflexi bacterium TSY]